MRSATRCLIAGLAVVAGCAKSSSNTPTPVASTTTSSTTVTTTGPMAPANYRITANPPSPDPRVGLKAGLTDAGEAKWNVRLVSHTAKPDKFDATNSDLAFRGNDVIQGNYNGYQIWDISDPTHPVLKTGYYCPASQSDVSVYKNLLFVSSESNSGRLDCGAEGVTDSVSHERIRGIRIFDATDITNVKYIGNVQTCRGSHTHTVLVDPKDPANVYVYISGSAGVRSPSELPGCSNVTPDKDPNSALFRIEVIKVPLAHPEQAAIVSSPRIFNDLVAPPVHGDAPEDITALKKSVDSTKAAGGFTGVLFGVERPIPPQMIQPLLDSVVKAHNGTAATSADSAALRSALPSIIAARFPPAGPRTGPSQCHDITVYPAIGLAGGACGGYGLLLDISDPAHPRRIDAAADSNFSYWHSATFNNDGTQMLFSDEWGGGGAPKCRSTDKPEWGADALFTIQNRKLTFKNYYKLPAAQTSLENCVAHNGSLIPIPGRDIMVQAWYQGGISVFDWTDAAHPVEIGYFDRGPVDPTRMRSGGSWSVYWYNGVMVSSEIARGLDIFELTPSPLISQNEIDAAKSIHYDYLNTQGQPHFVWPASFALARAYVDQLERGNGLAAARIASVRTALSDAEKASGDKRKSALNTLAGQLRSEAASAADGARVQKLAQAVSDLAAK